MAPDDRLLEKTQEKVNPFKELPKPKQPEASKEKEPKQKKEQQPRQRGEIVIRLNGWKVLKGLGVMMLLLAIFFAGRFSAGSSSLDLPDFSSFFSQDAGPSGLVTGEAPEGESEALAEPQAAEVPPGDDSANGSESLSDPVPSEEAEGVEEVEEKPETFVTEEYSLVTLSMDDVYKEWKGTWGKIIGVRYTITNNEKGTVKPHHFVMVVEGYEDGEKHFDVGIASQKVKTEQSVSDEAAVTGGFAYSPVSIPDGDLKKVRISLILQDVNNEAMASVHQEMDLSG